MAFISTWIATQLSLIQDSLPAADPYALYFQSIPANPYCLLTLLLVPLAIGLDWQPRAMRRHQPLPPDPDGKSPPASDSWRVLVPIATLALGIAASLQIWSGAEPRWLSVDGWRAAASGQGGPTALVAGALAGLATAWFCFPAARRREAPEAALRGASGLLPALVVLILAWSLGSVFEALGAAERLKTLLGDTLGQMSQQAETGDIGDGVGPHLAEDAGGPTVELAHDPHRALPSCAVSHPVLRRGLREQPPRLFHVVGGNPIVDVADPAVGARRSARPPPAP